MASHIIIISIISSFYLVLIIVSCLFIFIISVSLLSWFVQGLRVTKPNLRTYCSWSCSSWKPTILSPFSRMISCHSPTPESALTSPIGYSFSSKKRISFTQFLDALILILRIGLFGGKLTLCWHLSTPLAPANGELVPFERKNYIERILPTL